MTDPTNPISTSTTIVYVTAEGLPDAYVNGDDIELVVTQPVSATRAVVVIPLADAAAWAAEAYTAITVAYRDRTGSDIELAPVAHSGRIITGRLSDPGEVVQEAS